MVASILLTLGIFSSSAYAVAVKNGNKINATLLSRGLVKPWTVTDLYQGPNFFEYVKFFNLNFPANIPGFHVALGTSSLMPTQPTDWLITRVRRMRKQNNSYHTWITKR
jgi:hypothetical protein